MRLTVASTASAWIRALSDQDTATPAAARRDCDTRPSAAMTSASRALSLETWSSCPGGIQPPETSCAPERSTLRFEIENGGEETSILPACQRQLPFADGVVTETSLRRTATLVGKPVIAGAELSIVNPSARRSAI